MQKCKFLIISYIYLFIISYTFLNTLINFNINFYI